MKVEHNTVVHSERLNSQAAHDAIVQEVASWNGVSVDAHRFGGIEFRLGRRELGHLHASFADLPFSRQKRDALVSAGRALPHHIFPDSGWVTVPMRTKEEVENVIQLLRENFVRTAGAERQCGSQRNEVTIPPFP